MIDWRRWLCNWITSICMPSRTRPTGLHLPLSSLPIAFDQRLVFTAEHSATSEPSVWSTDEASAEHITSFPGDYFPIES